jgi:hypothetical protein
MRGFARLWAFVIASVVANAGSASAQASLVGSLDCQVVYSEAVVQRYRKIRCLYLSLHDYAPGFEKLTGSLTPKGPPPSGPRAVWGVYSLKPFSSLRGDYARRSGTETLVGPSKTELRPIADVPGEEIGRNLAFDATALILVVP